MDDECLALRLFANDLRCGHCSFMMAPGDARKCGQEASLFCFQSLRGIAKGVTGGLVFLCGPMVWFDSLGKYDGIRYS